MQPREDFNFALLLQDGTRVDVLQPVAASVVAQLERPDPNAASVTLVGYDADDQYKVFVVRISAIIAVAATEEAVKSLGPTIADRASSR